MRRFGSTTLLRSGRTIVASAAALFTAVFILRLMLPDPDLGISFLFVAPTVLMSFAFGIRGAAVATALSLCLMAFTTIVTNIPLGAGEYLVRGTVIAFVGLTAAAFAGMNRRLEAESTAWFEQDIDLHCIASKDGRFLRVNDAFVQTLGYAKEDLLSRPFIDFVHPEDREKTIAETIKLAENLGDTIDFENRYLANDGTYHWLRWSATPAPAGKIYASARDVTTQKELQNQLEALATSDALTGLANRRRFEDEAARALEHIARYGTGAAVFMLDLDGFKAVNDTVGHHAGDGVLSCVASKLRGRLRSSDLLARLGGDEFVILLPEARMPEAGALAEKLLVEVRDCSLSEDGVDLPIAASIGIAFFNSSSPWPLADVVRHADQAMYDAKRAGGDRYRIAAMALAQG